MRAKVIHERTEGPTPGERTLALIFDMDDEVIAGLTSFIRDHSTTAHGGHLREGLVRPTLEVMLVESSHFLPRTHDEERGLALIDIGASGWASILGRTTAGA